jgi:hypothetical protein
MDDPQMKVVKDFLSRILALPDMMNDPSISKIDISSSKMQDIFCWNLQVGKKEGCYR